MFLALFIMYILFFFCRRFSKLNAINDHHDNICLISESGVTINSDGITCTFEDKGEQTIQSESVYIKGGSQDNGITVEVPQDQDVFIYIEDTKIVMANNGSPLNVVSGIVHLIFSGNCLLESQISDNAAIQCSSLEASIVIQENEHNSGGLLTAISGGSSAAIGLGVSSTGCKLIHILSGNIHAKQYQKKFSDGCGAAIGGSKADATIESIIIESGDITAEAASKNQYGAAIGGGQLSRVNSLIIKGGNIHASAIGSSKQNGAAIGAGESGEVNSLIIEGGVIDAYASSLTLAGAAIGGGLNGPVKSIVIKGGDLSTATKVNSEEKNKYTNSATIGAGSKSYVNRLELLGGNIYAFGSHCSATIGGSIGATGSKGYVADIIIDGSHIEAPHQFRLKGHYASAIGGGYGSSGNSSFVNNLIIKSGSLYTYPTYYYYTDLPNKEKHNYSQGAMIGGGTGCSKSSYVKNIYIYDGILHVVNHEYATGAALGGGMAGESSQKDIYWDPTDTTATGPSGEPMEKSAYVENLIISGGYINLSSGRSAALGGGYRPLRKSTHKLAGSVEKILFQDSGVPLNFIASTWNNRSVISTTEYECRNFQGKDLKTEGFNCGIDPNNKSRSICKYQHDGSVSTFTSFYHLFSPYRNPFLIMIISAGFYNTFFYA